MYFVYIHCKPDGAPFYVGKGNIRRVMRGDLDSRLFSGWVFSSKKAVK
jgi:hypothetical protein